MEKHPQPAIASAIALKFGAFVALQDRERIALEGLHRRCRRHDPGTDLVRQGQSGQVAHILLSGWATSYKMQPDGSRQIIGVQVPGDFLGMRSLLLNTSDHGVEPVGDVRVAEILVGDMFEAFERSPRLAMAILWALSRDEAMLVEHMVRLGRRNALERTAHFLLELGSRLALVGHGTDTGYACPLTQFQLADTLGLSTVHVNRVLRQLREDGMITFRDGQVTFEDRGRLVALSGFDPAYLDQNGPLLG